jgi:hypothetical protein
MHPGRGLAGEPRRAGIVQGLTAPRHQPDAGRLSGSHLAAGSRFSEPVKSSTSRVRIACQKDAVWHGMAISADAGRRTDDQSIGIERAKSRHNGPAVDEAWKVDVGEQEYEVLPTSFSVALACRRTATAASPPETETTAMPFRWHRAIGISGSR